MKRAIKLILVLYLLAVPSLAKVKKATFDGQAALSYIKHLASDSMMGRESGQPGGVMAEEYIASKFKKWGIEPAGDNGTYFQNFTSEHSHVAEGVTLEIIANKSRRNFHYREDWWVWRFSGSGHFTAKIVFVGYGIHAPQEGYDDYAGVDVKGKLVLMMLGAPPKLKENFKEETERQRKVKAAQELGARGVLFLRNPKERSIHWYLKKDIYKKDFVILFVGDKISNFIFKDLKTELRYLLKEIDGSSKPMPYETGVKAFIAVNAIYDEKKPMRNVLAKISGTDRMLKNEHVIIGGHMDHLGINPLGEVMNGANDNASGSSVAMEIARVMKLNKVNTKRTVVFAFWAGEEQHLLGSLYYADHPLYPIEKTVAYINIDMVGHGSGKVDFTNIYYGPKIWKLLKNKLPKKILDYVVPIREFYSGNSDHASFLEKGVPGFMLKTEGYHFKYHRSRDDVDLIKSELLKKTGDLVEAAVEILANEPGNWIPPLRQENYYLKAMILINFKPFPLNEAVEKIKEVKDADVDLQLVVVEEKEGLDGDALRIDIIRKLLSVSEKIEKAGGLSFYSTPRKFRQDMYRQGKTSIMAGLRGTNAFRDDPRWVEVLAKQGLFFVIVDNPSSFFEEKGMSEQGKKIVEALNKSGLVLFFKGLKGSQARSLLEATNKPLILLEKDLPDKEVMDLIKNKNSALGLLLTPDEDAKTFFKKLEEAKKAIGRECLMIVNEESLWENHGRELMLKVTSEILKAKYGWRDIVYPFSRTFRRVLEENRGEESFLP